IDRADLNVVGFIFVLPILVYHVVMEITMNGQSVGKKIMGIKVVHENGGRASISQFLIRWLLRVSDVWMVVIIYIIYIVAEGYGIGHDAETTILILAVLAFLVVDIILVV